MPIIHNNFQIVEILSNISLLPLCLKVEPGISEQGKLIRLLTGTVDIIDLNRRYKFSLRDNYSNVSFSPNLNLSPLIFKKLIYPDYKISELESFLNKTKFQNVNFFRNVNHEVLSYFYQSSKKNHTTAFVHIYRMLEYISYTFPLIYAAKGKEYFQTFEALQSFFTQSNQELNFLNRFLEYFLDTDWAKDATVEIKLISKPIAIRNKHYTILYESIGNTRVVDKLEDVFLKIQYKHVIDLIVTLRNRYFHFQSNRNYNIQSSNMGDSDEFFSNINSIAFNWISYIYIKVLKFGIENQ
jgi:hypothetical protein